MKLKPGVKPFPETVDMATVRLNGLTKTKSNGRVLVAVDFQHNIPNGSGNYPVITIWIPSEYIEESQ